jgi:hypothetical protein
MIPAPGLMAFVGVPVSQMSVAEKPMARQQLKKVFVRPEQTWGPIITFLEPVVLEDSAQNPTATFTQPVVFLHAADKPKTVLQLPVVKLQSALSPITVLPCPPPKVYPAHSPMMALDPRVNPKTVPLTAGNAAGVLPPAVPQQTAFRPSDIKTWPAVPQEPAQSMIPAPGLIALVLVPVIQLSVAEKPIASWQEPPGEAT